MDKCGVIPYVVLFIAIVSIHYFWHECILVGIFAVKILLFSLKREKRGRYPIVMVVTIAASLAVYGILKRGTVSLGESRSACSNVSNVSFTMFGLILSRNGTAIDDNRSSDPACEVHWGLSELDHALLSRIAYFQSETDDKELEHMQKALAFAFPKDQYNVELNQNLLKETKSRNDDKESFNKYYQIDFSDRKHTVIAVQGTDTTAFGDVLTDMRLFGASILFDHCLRCFIPFTNYLSADSRSYLQGLMMSVQDYYAETRIWQVGPLVVIVGAEADRGV